MRTGTTFYKGAALLGIAMSLFFLSCDKELMNGGAARIRIAIADVPYGSDENGVRSAGEPKSETVVSPLDREDALCLYATLEEDRSELRAFTDNARLRIAVYDDTDAFVKDVIGTFSAGSFTLDGGETLDDITPGVDYTFVAYSLNSATEDPNDYKVGEALEDIDPSKDLLYGKSTLTTINSGTNTVLIPLKHKFSLVTLVARTTEYTSAVNITEVDAELLPGRTGNLPLIGVGAGTLSPVAASSETQGFDFESVNLGTQTATSNPRIVYTGGANPTKIMINSVTIPELDAAALSLNSEANLAFVLQPGTSYTLTVSLKDTPTGLWAGSNIYWDGEKLTFDPAGKTDHALYQGVFFRWGSLVGIMTTAYTNPYGVYVPNYDSGEPGESDWSVEAWNPNSIPYMASWDWYPSYLYRISDATSYGERKGDVCRYLGDTGAGPVGYQMPNMNSFSAFPSTFTSLPYRAHVNGLITSLINLVPSNGSWTGDPGGTTSLVSLGFGHYEGDYGFLGFPASGYYNGSYFAGAGGVYWNGQAEPNSYGLPSAYGWGLSQNSEQETWGVETWSNAYPYNQSEGIPFHSPTYGHVIRCIKN
jgi:hypothetical protein